jgi:hypothetical protein
MYDHGRSRNLDVTGAVRYTASCIVRKTVSRCHLHQMWRPRNIWLGACPGGLSTQTFPENLPGEGRPGHIIRFPGKPPLPRAAAPPPPATGGAARGRMRGRMLARDCVSP